MSASQNLPDNGSPKRGTFYVGVTVSKPQDGTNADTMKFGYWPGTAEGKTPPETFAEAAEYAVKSVDAVKDLPSDGVCEVRITTYEQGGDDDPVAFLEREVERLENLCLDDDNYRCESCERVFRCDEIIHGEDCYLCVNCAKEIAAEYA